jgi:hypothetical protein
VLIFVRRKTLRKKKKRQVDFGEPWTSHKHTHTKKEQGKHTKVSKEKNQISIGSFSPCPVELDASQWGISPALHTFSLAYFCTVRSVDWTLGSHSHWPMWKSLSGPIEDEICKGTVWKMRGQSFERYRSAKHQTVVGWLIQTLASFLPALLQTNRKYLFKHFASSQKKVKWLLLFDTYYDIISLGGGQV